MLDPNENDKYIIDKSCSVIKCIIIEIFSFEILPSSIALKKHFRDSFVQITPYNLQAYRGTWSLTSDEVELYPSGTYCSHKFRIYTRRKFKTLTPPPSPLWSWKPREKVFDGSIKITVKIVSHFQTRSFTLNCGPRCGPRRGSPWALIYDTQPRRSRTEYKEKKKKNRASREIIHDEGKGISCTDPSTKVGDFEEARNNIKKKIEINLFFSLFQTLELSHLRFSILEISVLQFFTNFRNYRQRFLFHFLLSSYK